MKIKLIVVLLLVSVAGVYLYDFMNFNESPSGEASEVSYELPEISWNDRESTQNEMTEAMGLAKEMFDRGEYDKAYLIYRYIREKEVEFDLRVGAGVGTVSIPEYFSFKEDSDLMRLLRAYDIPASVKVDIFFRMDRLVREGGIGKEFFFQGERYSGSLVDFMSSSVISMQDKIDVLEYIKEVVMKEDQFRRSNK